VNKLPPQEPSLLLRYGTESGGKIVRKAKIYTNKEHKISRNRIDRDATWIVRKLAEAGFQAYIVGGAVRDLLLGDQPKDFDVATDAVPSRIRKIFRRSRIIGRRFRLVHVYFRGQKIIEVSTFRAAGAGSDNTFGTLVEDVMRRDFSINALFYDPIKGQLVDYVEGLPDVRHGILRTLSRPKDSFREDPVRMLRAIKYAAPHDFRMTAGVRRSIRRYRHLLLDCSPDRLTEEFFKIMGSGGSRAVMDLAVRHRLFEILFPRVAVLPDIADSEWDNCALAKRLGELDGLVRAESTVERGDFVAVFFRDVVEAQTHDNTLDGIQSLVKELAKPLKISNKDSRHAARLLQRRHEPGSRRRRRRSRRRRSQRNVSMRLKSESTLSP
jgi:poly(A) polymerase